MLIKISPFTFFIPVLSSLCCLPFREWISRHVFRIPMDECGDWVIVCGWLMVFDSSRERL
ncbi:hypothetical protein [Paenibacillus pinihumi]|uniref:hypothetical protein n=1 Tax=Paenibacillus pinihumi TaxID=669462 RepID=UPI00048D36FF|nr:hypothetical protein [Paenibacillus pinihumi]